MSSNNIILFGDLTVAGFGELEIIKLTIHQKVNEHTTMHLFARIKNENADGYLERLVLNESITIVRDGKPIYVGLLLEPKAVRIDSVSCVDINSVSLTYLMDIDKKSRSFQHTPMTYKEVQDIVTDNSVYPKASFIDFVSNGRNIGRPIIQYWETDWEFLRRLSTHFHSVLVPSSRMDGPAYYFGLPNKEAVDIKALNYKETWDFNEYKHISAEVPSVTPLDFTIFEAEVFDIYELGQKAMFNGVACYIGETTFSYENSIIRNMCRFYQKNGLSTLHMPNLNIAGCSIFGKVIATARDVIKIHLDIDEEQKLGEAYWYPYATMYASQGEVGWYCMPEIDDVIRLYHPNGDEGLAMTINAIKPHPNNVVENLPPTHRMADVDVKYIRTAFGKEIKWRPDGIDIIAKDNKVFVSMNDDGTIYVNADDKMSVTAVNDIVLKSKNINLEALERIELKSKAGTIVMEEEITVHGEEVKTN